MVGWDTSEPNAYGDRVSPSSLFKMVMINEVRSLS